jgi:aldehyde dehydrogenase (NAD(P)+)
MTSQQVLPEQRAAGVDALLADLVRGEAIWAATSVTTRRHLLEQVHELTGRHAQAWVDAALSIKGLADDSPLVGEEWLSGPYAILTGTAALAASLQALERGRSPVDGFAFGRAPGNRVTVRGLPHTVFDRLLLSGFTADVWMPPGVDEQAIRDRAGLAERDPAQTHGVSAVLGAGNISSIPPLDVIYELYAHNRVVALKLNPITDPLLAVFEQVFRPLIDHGVLRILTGGADVGGYLVQHDQVTHVHMTGSAATHDAIVFGSGPDRAERKAQNRPLITKQITSELGGVSPIIVLPGHWSPADLAFQAAHIATQRLHNGGYNCIAGQVVVLSSEWGQKEEFLSQLRAAFDRAPGRKAYYPGSDERVEGALDAFSSAERFGPDRGRVLASSVSDAERAQLLHTEFFSPVLGVIELPGAGLDFLTAAVSTANDDFSGTLGVNLIADPGTIKELGESFENAVADLRYGCVAINAWTGLGFLTSTASWGAFPGHTLSDVQSGIGVVHNALLLENPERTVVRGPFRPFPRSVAYGELSITPNPPWFVNNRTAPATARALTAFATKPGWTKLPRIFASALRG